MRELSLHILDALENALRAEATVVVVTVEQDTRADRLDIAVEDNGPGFTAPSERALDPFYTTKEGKRTGLGLSLFRASAERAGGRMDIGRSELGGAAVRATLELSHLDRAPLGDLAGALLSVALTSPDVDLRARLRLDGREVKVHTAEVAADLPGAGEMRVAREFTRRVRAAGEALGLRD